MAAMPQGRGWGVSRLMMSVVLVGVLVVGVVGPAGAVPWQEEPRTDLAATAPQLCSQDPQPVNRFPDVAANSTFCVDIAWMADAGITVGRTDGTFGPSGPVTRGQMAAFMYRFAGEPSGPFESAGFPDVPSSYAFVDEIAWMAAEGITEGRADGTFGPQRTVTRGQMAAFMYRFAGEPSGPFESAGFPDVPPSYAFASEIAWMATTGITEGRADGTFGPQRTVTRAQMAAFMNRFASLDDSDDDDDGSGDELDVELQAAGQCTEDDITIVLHAHGDIPAGAVFTVTGDLQATFEGSEWTWSGLEPAVYTFTVTTGEVSETFTVDLTDCIFDDPTDPDGPRLVTTWDTTLSDDTTIELPFRGEVDVDIHWGDGTTSSHITGPASHTYAADGTYTVTTFGTFEAFGSVPDQHAGELLAAGASLDSTDGEPLPVSASLVSVDEWEATGTVDLTYAFFQARNLATVAEPPSTVTSMRGMFAGATSFNQPIGSWDVAAVTDMDGMFAGATGFNQDLSTWCVAGLAEAPEEFDAGTSAWELAGPDWGNPSRCIADFCHEMEVSEPTIPEANYVVSDFTGLQQAITDPDGIAGGGLVIEVAGDIDLVEPLEYTLAVPLYLIGDAEDRPVLNGGGEVRIFNAPSGAPVTVVGLTFANGFAWANGAALLSMGDLQIVDTTFRDNGGPLLQLDSRGGTIEAAGDVSLLRTTLTGSQAHDYGAIYIGGNLSIVLSDLSDVRWDAFGPGILAQGEVDLVCSTFSRFQGVEGLVPGFVGDPGVTAGPGTVSGSVFLDNDEPVFSSWPAEIEDGGGNRFIGNAPPDHFE
jgi:surface protein